MTINYDREDLKTRVRELTDGAGADVVYDPVGGPYSEPAVRATAWDGRFLVVGFAAGEIPRIPLNLPLLKSSAIVGVFYGMGEGLRQEEERRAARIESKAKVEEPEAPVAVADQDKNRGDNPRRRNPDDQELPFRSDNWFFKSVNAVHYVLPRAKDLDHLMSRLLIRDVLTANQIKEQKIDDTRISWGESLTVSGAFVALVLGLACLRFATKDY